MSGLRWAGLAGVGYLGLVALAYAVGGNHSPCAVGVAAKLVAVSGDTANLTGLVAGHPSRGVEVYRDAGPAHALQMTASKVTTLSCTRDARIVTIGGNGTLAGGGTVSFRIEIRLGRTTTDDTYRIQIGGIYDSGIARIAHGSLTIGSGTSRWARRYSSR